MLGPETDHFDRLKKLGMSELLESKRKRFSVHDAGRDVVKLLDEETCKTCGFQKQKSCVCEEFRKELDEQKPDGSNVNTANPEIPAPHQTSITNRHPDYNKGKLDAINEMTRMILKYTNNGGKVSKDTIMQISERLLKDSGKEI